MTEPLTPPELPRPNPPESPRPTPPELPRPTPAERPQPDLERFRTLLNDCRQLLGLEAMEPGSPVVAPPPPRDPDDLETAIEDCRFSIEHCVDLFGALEYDICAWDVDRRQRGALLLGFAVLADKVAELGTLLDQADRARRAAKKPAPLHEPA